MFTLSRTIGLPAELSILKESGNTATFEIKGLHPGYGHTMANALRRIILSSLSGVSVVSIKITGIDHEFSAIEGIREDALRIALNLQQVRARIISGSEYKTTIKVTGPSVVTAADIQTDANLEIANPDQYICEITQKGFVFEAEIVFATGIGFVPKSQFHKDRISAGTILVDAVFTPIRRVFYDVENMRVGDRTDYNKVILGVETDGTLTPKEALDSALRILLVQTQSLLSLSDSDAQKLYSSSYVAPVDLVAEAEIDTTDTLKTRIETLNFTSRTLNALTEANIRTVGGLVRKTEADILSLDGIGPKGVEEVKSVLTDMGLGLKE
jgi:DNA-directed RNA polymerase subunit alpha